MYSTGRSSRCGGHAIGNFSLSFNHLDRNIPAALAVHLIADNYATHKHPRITAWLARHPRYHIHYTPAYASWLNQVERWFGLITQRAIRRGSLRSVSDLICKIDSFVTHYNASSKPFIWTATADSVFDKLQRLCKLINGTLH
jgi:transposase